MSSDGGGFVFTNCPLCHIRYAIPASVDRKARDKGPKMSVHCPAGHEWYYVGESEAVTERARRQLAEQANARLADELNATKRRLAEQTALAKRRAGRTAAGVCPCCNRSFMALKRHMATKHPEFVNQPA